MKTDKRVLKILEPRMLLALVVASVVMIALFFANTGESITVNGIALNASTDGQAFVENDVTYAPLQAIVEKMGDKTEWNNAYRSLTVTQTNGKVFVVTMGKSTAFIDNKVVPLLTHELNSVIIPVDAKAKLQNGKIYAPIDFIIKNFGYPVNKVGSMINFGQVPASQTDATKENSTVNENQKIGTTTSDARKMTSTWTTDPVANIKAISDELELNNGGTTATFDPIEGNANIHILSVVSMPTDTGMDGYVVLKAWNSSNQQQQQQGYDKIKPISKELFKFYSPTGYNKLYNMVDASWSGSYSYTGKTYNFDNREYGIRIDDESNTIALYISKPGQKLPPLKGVNM